MASLPGNRVACSPQSLAWLRKRFLEAAGITPETLRADRKIYIPRKKGGWRSVLNDDELIPQLTNAGFEVFSAEGMTLREQILLFAEARIIVGLHGAGLTNILYAPRSTVLELFGSYGGGEYYSMTTCLGQKYRSLECQRVGEDVMVDIPKLMKVLEVFDEVQGHSTLIVS